MAEREEQEADATNRFTGWWLGNSLRISSHAVERAREYGPKELDDLSNKELGHCLAGAIYNPAIVDLRVVDPVRDIVYQVAVPFEYDGRSVGYALLSPDKDEPEIVVCTTVLRPSSWQLFGNTGVPLPGWYLKFCRRTGVPINIYQ